MLEEESRRPARANACRLESLRLVVGGDIGSWVVERVVYRARKEPRQATMMAGHGFQLWGNGEGGEGWGGILWWRWRKWGMEDGMVS